MGGLMQPFIIPMLARKTTLIARPRDVPAWLDLYAHEGPKVMLTNEYAGSGGDLLPWMFRSAGLGTLIGTRTGGLLTGYFERTVFVDGGNMSTPQFIDYDLKTGKKLPENYGTTPDIEVDLRQDQVALGKDSQLDAGIRHLMRALARAPVKRPSRAGG
jgi:tricorn protease